MVNPHNIPMSMITNSRIQKTVNADLPLKKAENVYTCPMHPEISQAMIIFNKINCLIKYDPVI